MFGNEDLEAIQAFIVVEGQILCEVSDATIIKSLTVVIATYYAFYICYPKSAPAAGLLLLIQELLLDKHEEKLKKTTRYLSLFDSIVIMD